MSVCVEKAVSKGLLSLSPGPFVLCACSLYAFLLFLLFYRSSAIDDFLEVSAGEWRTDCRWLHNCTCLPVISPTKKSSTWRDLFGHVLKMPFSVCFPSACVCSYGMAPHYTVHYLPQCCCVCPGGGKTFSTVGHLVWSLLEFTRV